MTDSKWKRIS